MKIYKEESLRSFEFWRGAKYTAETLTCEELDQIESLLEDLYPDGVDETTVNDIFWFEEDWIAEMLGFEDWEALERDHNGEEEEEEEEEEEDEEEEEE
jgi:hypothetical protein